ncbi:hypothetical protein [Pedobacter sp. PACM 27299]|uniref:hypothetical protein n=1 Tax=Pedobacter sp. PACM 27299 TaxID=1727164 RepID=UPI002FF71A70
MRHSTPYLRKLRLGHVFNISSIGGFVANFPGFGIYCATKFAGAGLSVDITVRIVPAISVC